MDASKWKNPLGRLFVSEQRREEVEEEEFSSILLQFVFEQEKVFNPLVVHARFTLKNIYLKSIQRYTYFRCRYTSYEDKIINKY